ncbi:MAG: hypothetical protein TREMPRED_004315 [Tremellales sp. Tagirdzhanova-0007]|nr:MAG: hypothetical protein TREMPRED_004315 [Tremellales sp. Tagirdzhanova-0007]
MAIYHIVAFKLSDPSKLPQLTRDFLTLEKRCARENGKPYIVSVKGGDQISTESRDHGMQIVFILEFANKEDLAHYVDEDKAHINFKGSLPGLGVEAAVVMDFADGTYPK